ncbi:MAG: hypothetical protein GXP25_25180 [Planctomycetes bacterium]|nr:hypothetical protein [Planctomycetota bacterium]
MEKRRLTFDFVCPVCGEESRVSLDKEVFSTFIVECPACGKRIKLSSIKGFKQIRFRKPSKGQLRRDFRDAENPSEN